VGDPAFRVRLESIRGLGDVGLSDENVIEVLREAVKHDDPRIRFDAQLSLAKLGFVEEALPGLLPYLQDPANDLSQTEVVLEALEKAGPKALASDPYLQPILVNPVREACFLAGRALKCVKGAKAVRDFVKALGNNSP